MNTPIPSTIWQFANTLVGFPVVSVTIGAVIGAVISWLFARQSSKELREAAKELHQQSNFIMAMLEQVSQGRELVVRRNDNGERAGMVSIDRNAPGNMIR
ncbi:YtxH domain-containing protein [Dyella jiangningensis]|uniref:YtxH domain-containing protein n=1 Tax=Dyella jiangningensis TaxID=1379159 RepID=UPI002410618D|nr:YtxH domain-containing protein [Dyella jiangningensis]MDG2537787.1 YtxH domain-containing protein [Dyella jiangningensis]